MNFKIKPFALFLAGAALVMTGCKDDVFGDVDSTVDKGEGHYLHVKAAIALPGGTRSATDDPTNNGNDMTNSDVNNEKDEDGYNLEDFEYGSAYENEIRTMILVYTDANNNYITHSVVDGITKAPVTGQKYEYEVIGEIEHEKLQAAYESGVLKDLANDETPIPVRVWAICNFTENLANLFSTAGPTTLATWMDWTGNVKEGPSVAGRQPTIDNTIWAQRSFLMTNAEVADVTFPGSIEEWDEYTDKSTPWELKANDPNSSAPASLYAIKVERASARLDIRDGSEGKDQTYHLYTHENSYGDNVGDDGQQQGEGELNLIDMKLTRMALVNMSRNFYYLRRVSADGTNTGWNYCGKETTVNATDATPFVVDTDYEAKKNRSIKAVNENFNFPLYTEDSLYNKSAWYIDNYAQILEEGKTDNWSGSAGNKYRIWRYVTENTIPGAENQITVQSTGVVFKGRILLGADAEEDGADHYISQDLIDALSETDANSAILYRFENRLFAGPKDIIAGAAQDGTNSTLYGAVKNILSNWKLDSEGKTYKLNGSGDEVLTPARANDILFNKADPNVDPAVKEMDIADLTDANFSKFNTPKTSKISMFRPEVLDEGDGDTGETHGYYCYYFYWNRHNDNSKSGLMGPMEFATVRNNVYKLAVTGIGKIGHPTTPGDDDDPEEPNDPDEDPTNYIQVSVEVLPWVVRVNDIEF